MDIQNQKATDGSIAIQAGGNITVNDYSQIREIFNDLFRLNFPELVKEASEKAQLNMKEYLSIFIAQVAEAERGKIQESLKRPDSQFLLNASIQNAARYGNGIDLNMLSSSVKNALLADDDLLTNLFTYASEIIPRLTKRQMMLILVVFYVHNLGFREDIVNALMLEILTKQCFGALIDFQHVTDFYKLHLVTLGVFTSNYFAGDTAMSLFERKYPSRFKTEIKPALDNGQMPFLKQVMDFYDSNSLVKYPIAPIGSAIGFLIAKEAMPALDMNILKAL